MSRVILEREKVSAKETNDIIFFIYSMDKTSRLPIPESCMNLHSDLLLEHMECYSVN